jgi:ectoine hydroxylase-related dioxygenase (phytanoyl-CoA dioxygenase family)
MDSPQRAFADAIETDGWAVTGPVVDDGTLSSLRDAVSGAALDGRGGARNLLENARVRALAVSPPMRLLASSVLGPQCFAVRALLFDKTPGTNWKVIWHQDLTIASERRVEVPGFGPWTEKEGVPHVQPPAEVLDAMLAVRLHLDPCGPTNGPVRVISGSHRVGRLSAEAIDELRSLRAPEVCVVETGGVLAFRPLLLHASSPSQQPGHRRVIHIEYAACELPSPLAWHRRVA